MVELVVGFIDGGEFYFLEEVGLLAKEEGIFGGYLFEF